MGGSNPDELLQMYGPVAIAVVRRIYLLDDVKKYIAHSFPVTSVSFKICTNVKTYSNQKKYTPKDTNTSRDLFLTHF